MYLTYTTKLNTGMGDYSSLLFAVSSFFPSTYPPLSLRCHTFGIGPEVCVELVKGIAVESGGQCVLLEDGERLQTKVCI